MPRNRKRNKKLSSVPSGSEYVALFTTRPPGSVGTLSGRSYSPNPPFFYTAQANATYIGSESQNVLPKGYEVNTIDPRYTNLGETVAQINPRDLQKISSAYFYDPVVMQNIRSYLVKQITSLADAAALAFATVPQKRIGAASTFGKVYLVGANNDADYQKYINDLLNADASEIGKIIYGSPSLFVNKYSGDSILKQLHEYLVGIELNELRAEHCPYFVYTFTYEQCGGITVGANKKIENVCNAGAEGAYITIENIPNAISSEEYFKNPRNYQYLPGYVMIVAYAAKRAFDKLGYVHGDYHLGNCLIMNPDVEYWLPIEFKGQIVYINMMGCPMNIDFGASSTNKNPWIGYNSSPKSTPMHDLIPHIRDVVKIASRGYNSLSPEQKVSQGEDAAKIVRILDLINQDDANVDDNANKGQGRGWIFPTVILGSTVEMLIDQLFTNFNYEFTETSVIDSSAKHSLHYTEVREFSLDELFEFPELRAGHLEESLKVNRKILQDEEKLILKLENINTPSSHSEASYFRKNSSLRLGFINDLTPQSKSRK